MACNWNRCKRCGKVSEKEYCKKCKRKIIHRKVFVERHNTEKIRNDEEFKEDIKASEYLAKLGVSVFNEKGEFRSLVDIIEQCSNAYKICSKTIKRK